MTIEKDIKMNRNFRNEHHKALVNIIYTHGWVMNQMKKLLGQEDLTPQQYNILRILRGSYPIPLSTSQIRDRMLDKMSDTSRLVDRLIRKGLLVKKSSEHDKRLVEIFISETGQELMSRMEQSTHKIDNVVGRISEEEAKNFNFLLDKIRNSE